MRGGGEAARVKSTCNLLVGVRVYTMCMCVCVKEKEREVGVRKETTRG